MQEKKFYFDFFGETYDQQKKAILLGFILLIFIHVIFVFAGFYNNDDINYSRYAADLINRGFVLTPATDHFQLRWTIIYGTAFFYKLFGINAFTSSLCSFISIALCGFLLKKITSAYKPLVFFLTLLPFFFAHSILFYMHRLLPDPALCFASLWMYFSYRSSTQKQEHTFVYALQFSLALLLAIVTKETVIIVLPLFAVFFLLDIFNKRKVMFWLYVILLATTLLFFYLLYFKLSSGSYLFRYYQLQLNSYFNLCSFDKLPLSFTLRRIGYYLWQAMLLNGDLLIMLPALAAFIYRNKLKRYVLVNTMDFFAFLMLLLAANFMTVSFTAYIPLCHDPRHFLFLFPFASIIIGPLLFAYNKSPSSFIMLPLFLLGATIVSFYINAGTTKYLYLLFTIVLLLRLLLNIIPHFESARLPQLFLIAIILLFSINYFIDFIKPPYPYYWSHKKIIDRNFRNKNIAATIFSSDDFSREMTEYFLQFDTGNLKVLPMSSAEENDSKNNYYVLVGDLNKAAQVKMDSLMKENRDPEVHLVDREKRVFLYKLNKSVLQALKENQGK